MCIRDRPKTELNKQPKITPPQFIFAIFEIYLSAKINPITLPKGIPKHIIINMTDLSPPNSKKKLARDIKSKVKPESSASETAKKSPIKYFNIIDLIEFG